MLHFQLFASQLDLENQEPELVYLTRDFIMFIAVCGPKSQKDLQKEVALQMIYWTLSLI